MAYAKAIFVGAIALVLGGCTGSTNPETASLFDNIKNLDSGEYDNQIQSNKSQADAILRNNQASQSRISGLENQSAANKSAIAALRAQVSAAQGAASAARARSAGDSAKLSQVSSLEAQLRLVSAEVNSGQADPGVTSPELRRIRAALALI